MSKNDGGTYSANWTVRDEFAAKALMGLLAENAHPKSIRGSWGHYATFVNEAFAYADAMLAERAKAESA